MTWFVVIGAIQYLVDVALLYGLLLLGTPIIPANLTSRASIGLLGFWANSRITFAETRAPLSSSLIRFGLLWCVATVVSSLGLLGVIALLFPDGYSSEQGAVAKMIVECAVFLMSFLVQKHVIFKD